MSYVDIEIVAISNTLNTAQRGDWRPFRVVNDELWGSIKNIQRSTRSLVTRMNMNAHNKYFKNNKHSFNMIGSQRLIEVDREWMAMGNDGLNEIKTEQQCTESKSHCNEHQQQDRWRDYT